MRRSNPAFERTAASALRLLAVPSSLRPSAAAQRERQAHVESSLDLTFTPDARERFISFLSSITDYPPTLCLMKAVNLDEPEGWWTYGAYGPSNIETVGPMLEERGHSLLYRAEGLLIAIPQYQFISELVGKTIGLGEDRLIVLHREPRA